MSLVWTLERVMGRSAIGSVVEVYAPNGFDHGFQTIVDLLGLHHGDNRHSDELIEAINSNMSDGEIDLVVLGTCEVDFGGSSPWPAALLAAWDAGDAAHKFQLVCIVHHVQSRRNAIRILSISEHVAAAFRRAFVINADSLDATMRLAGYEHIRVDAHVPVLDIPVVLDHSPGRILSDAVSQGSFASDRLDYLEIFADSKESLAHDPKVWGYLPLGAEDDASYIFDTTLPDPPFRLFLIGSGSLEIPQELKNMVLIRDDLNYAEFYNLMSNMDICLPAFRGDNEYYEEQASSTFAMAVKCNVGPILPRPNPCYRAHQEFVDDDRAVVTRPAAMRAIEAVRVLRTRNTSFFLHRTGIPIHSPTAQAAASMLKLGWIRSAGEFRAFKEQIWRANDRVVERMLRDL
ncbi:hypothetical protein DFH08DRAFT_949854 [Mycena albidolilacea]|uniref:Uncharacterized protein n=1 Tax=Mycena albidolilacea TaxID=1033008 RepID=A0AAD7AP49_9AGAR|nr:hypothetical protein DFH08DRAFT_949854 [Mycena albidolilacea]